MTQSQSILGPAFQSGLLNIVPFWSAQTLSFLHLGNEYGMVSTMLLSHLVKNVTVTWADDDWLFVTFCVVAALVLFRARVVRQLLGSLFLLIDDDDANHRDGKKSGARYCLLFEGREEHFPSIHRMDLHYPEEMQALNEWIVSNERFQNHHFILSTSVRNDNRKELVMPVIDLVLHRTKECTIYLEVSRHKHSSIFRLPVQAEYDKEGIAKDSVACVLDRNRRLRQDRIVHPQSSSPFAVLRTLFVPFQEESSSSGEAGIGRNLLAGAVSENDNGGDGNQKKENNTDKSASSSENPNKEPIVYVKYTVYMYASSKDGANSFSLWRWLFGGRKKKEMQKEEEERCLVQKMHDFMNEIKEKHRVMKAEKEKTKMSELVLSGVDNYQTGEISFHPGMYAIDAWIARFHPKVKLRCVFQSFHLSEKAEQNKKKEGDDSSGNDEFAGEVRLKQKKKRDGGGDSGGGEGVDASKQENQVKVSLELDKEGAVVEIDLNEEMRLRAYRFHDCINYVLIAKKTDVDCKKSLEKLILWHADEGDQLFKKSIRMNGVYFPIYSYYSGYGTATATYRIPKPMWHLSWYVDMVANISGVLMPADDPDQNSTSKYRFLVDGGRWVKLKDDLFLKTFSEHRNRYGDDVDSLSYVLVSNSVDVKEFLQEVEQMFEAWIKEKKMAEQSKGSKKVWYFKYLGMEGGELRFHKTLLSEKGTENECFMTFDHIHHEHKERMIEDVKRLDDMEYYQKFGLNRKVGFTLYGPPGTCKTRSAIALAIEFDRHLIDIDLSIVKTKDEFHRLTHLEKIMGIDITDRTSLLLFDEIDVGMQKIIHATQGNESTPVAVVAAFDDVSKKPQQAKTTDSELTISTVLTVLDPAEPRHGAVWIACTNNIDKLPEAFCRSMRMTALYLGELKREHAIAIIRKYFEIVDPKSFQEVQDRFWIPTKLITQCRENHNKMSLEEFVHTVLVPAQRVV